MIGKDGDDPQAYPWSVFGFLSFRMKLLPQVLELVCKWVEAILEETHRPWRDESGALLTANGLSLPLLNSCR